MKQLAELLNPENLKYVLVILGIALLGRSLAVVNPEYAVSIITPDNGEQGILKFVGIIDVSRYIMSMLWPLAYALLNSIHIEARVSKEFFYIVVGAHVIALTVAFVWFLIYEPAGLESVPVENRNDQIRDMHIKASLIYSVGLLVSILGWFWFKKGWFAIESKEKNRPEEPGV
jgi:hypothetical protein